MPAAPGLPGAPGMAGSMLTRQVIDPELERFECGRERQAG